MKVKKGGVILQSDPYAFILYPEYKNILCNLCLKEIQACKEQICACRSCVYCCKNCMLQDEMHASECELLITSGSKPSTSTSWLLLRVWLKYSRELEENSESSGELVPGFRLKRTFGDFLSHEKDIRRDKKKMQHILDHYRDLESILLEEMPSFDEFVELYGKVVINNFELRQSSSGESYGMGVYLAPSIVDHSCVPNAWVEISGKRLTMKSLVEVDNFSMDQVFFSYINTEARFEVRQEYLKKYFFFTCKCLKCLTEI